MAGLKQTLFITVLLGIATAVVMTLTLHIREVPSLSSIKKTFRSDNLTILDRNGRVIDEVVKKAKVRRLNWVTLDQVPASFVEAVRRSESWRLTPNSITMQLAQSRFWPSLALEMAWSKKQILEAYINLSVYRGELQGVAAASQAIFDRPPEKLTRAQGAVLASLIHSKDKGVDRVRGKACALLKSLDAGEDCPLINEKHLAALERSFQVRPFVQMAPHVASLLESLPELREGNVVRSTLDRELQWTALHALQKRNAAESAAVVIDNRTGEVLAYVGNSGVEMKSAYQDLARQPRQGGAALKPFLFAQALDERTLTTTTVIEDKPELVTLKNALLENLKLPAIRVLEGVGVENFVRALGVLGFRPLERAEFYGPSLALGSADVKLIDLANAYRALANKGMWSPIRFSPDGVSEEAPRRVFSEGAAYIISDVLKDPGNSLYWTSLMCDPQWCVGYSQKYTVAVLNGGREAWYEIMSQLHRTETSEAPRPPLGLSQMGGEWYLEGTIPEDQPVAKVDLQSRISYPVDKTVVELDAKKPKEHKRMFIQVVAPKPNQNLYLNGRRLGRAQSRLPWTPENGKFVLELRDSKGTVLHKVRFRVRGLDFAGGNG